MLKGRIPPVSFKVSIIDRAIRSPINWLARTSGIEPTPALTHIRRAQNEEREVYDMPTALKQALEVIAQGEAGFVYDHYYQRDKVGFLEDERRRLREQVVYLAQSLRYSLSDISALENSNNELRSAVEKLRAKVVEQDEVIKKLIVGNTGKDRSVC